MNPARGEAGILVDGATCTLRPSFQALVAAEQELGSLFLLVERAAEARVTLAETVALLWHCLLERDAVPRERLGEAVAQMGLAEVAPVLRVLIVQILKGA